MLISALASAFVIASVPTAIVLASNTFADGTTMPDSAVYSGYGCTGQNQPPELHWSQVPAGTKSFALTVYDPDASGGWWHWVIFDIPGSATSLPAGSQLSAQWVEGTSSFDSIGYGGPCPPPGKVHHYIFTLYALSVSRVPGANSKTTGPQLMSAMEGHILGKGVLTGLYKR